MVIKPTLLQHPKFMALERAVGGNALKYLVRLWGHCESEQRGSAWANAGAAYVEAVCQWEGPGGNLFEALLTPVTKNGAGWIELNDTGLVIHDWEEFNATLVAAWKARRKGAETQNRKNKARDTSSDTSSDISSDASPDTSSEHRPSIVRAGDRIGSDRTGSEGSGSPPAGESGAPTPMYPPPSVDFVLAHAHAVKWPFTDAEIQAVYLQFAAATAPDGSWMWGKRMVTDWRAAMFVRLRDAFEKKNAPASAGSEVVSLNTQIRELNRQMENLEGHPEKDMERNRLERKRAELIERLKKLTEGDK